MRHKDENKIKAIDEAVIAIIINEGYQNMSIAKIAKRAGISQATMYIYYANKQAMLGHLYLEIKDRFDEILFDGVDVTQPLREQLTLVLTNFARAGERYPREAVVMQVFNNNPSLVAPEVYQAGQVQAQILVQLYQKGMAQQVLRPMSPELMIAFTFQPLTYLMTQKYEHGEKLTQAELAQAIEMTWAAIRS